MKDNPASIEWPAVIHYENDAELEYVENEQHWLQQPDWREGDFESRDRLIDSEGQVFSLLPGSATVVLPVATGDCLSLNEVLGLVKAHLADQGSCCVAKTYAPTIRDAILMVINTECRIEGND
mgnify:FL=1